MIADYTADERVLGAVAAFEREGLVVDVRRITTRVELKRSTVGFALRRLRDEGTLRTATDEPGTTALYYSLGDVAAEALDGLPIAP